MRFQLKDNWVALHGGAQTYWPQPQKILTIASMVRDVRPDFESDLAAYLKQDKDRSYDLYDVLQITKALPPQAAPDSGRSYCADTTHQRLGPVIEAVSGSTRDQALQSRICEPLELRETGVLLGCNMGPSLSQKQTAGCPANPDAHVVG